MVGNETYISLRQQHQLFVYESFQIEKGEATTTITFRFSVDDFVFLPEWVFSNSYYENDEMDEELFQYMVFHLGLAELISYWKCCCPAHVQIRAGQLSEAQLAWWKKLYYFGLSEFFYTNGIPAKPDDFMTLTCESERAFHINQPKCEAAAANWQGFFIPVGGGKDSVVTLELLKCFRPISKVFIVNPRGATLNCAKIAGFSEKDMVTPTRKIDKTLLWLNQQGYLNGHTPFSAVLAFSSYLFAYMGAMPYIPLSNESSANESYVKDQYVNHQYSKSTEFEADFRDYTSRYLVSRPEYFSLLRPFNELGIVAEFAKHPAYFPIFRSCNAGSKTDSWCGTCSKCLFVTILLSALLPPETILEILHTNMLQDEKLLPMFDSLVSPDLDKPFECIGTREEINAAIQLAGQRFPQTKAMPLFAHYFQKYGDQPAFNKEIINYFDNNHFVPEKLVPLLKESPFSKQIVEALAHKKILILGFGREGQSTYEFIRQHQIPVHSIGIADAEVKNVETYGLPEGVALHTGKDYLACAKDYDCIFKSPGVSLKEKAEALQNKITSQTDMFLRFCKQNTIGVTGTKGKSTTASLIYHMLLHLGEPVVLMGNIGIPPFSVLDTVKENTRVVFELSSHQLEFVENSPHIAVLLNIYGEHLDHYLSYAHYKAAKYNIFRYQNSDDLLLYNMTSKEIDAEQVEKTSGKKIRLSDQGFVSGADIYAMQDIYLNGLQFKKERIQSPLFGEHTLYNILFGLAVVQHLGLDVAKAAQALKTFQPLSHRMEYVGAVQGRHFYNDSISTIPESAMCAVRCFEKVDTLLIGGMNRGVDYTGFAAFLSGNEAIDHVICMPESGYLVYELVQKIGTVKNFYKAENLEQAVRLAKELTPEGGLCLLSPAAASYGYFKDFAARGEAFKKYVIGYEE